MNRSRTRLVTFDPPFASQAAASFNLRNEHSYDTNSIELRYLDPVQEIPLTLQ